MVSCCLSIQYMNHAGVLVLLKRSFLSETWGTRGRGAFHSLLQAHHILKLNLDSQMLITHLL